MWAEIKKFVEPCIGESNYYFMKGFAQLFYTVLAFFEVDHTNLYMYPCLFWPLVGQLPFDI